MGPKRPLTDGDLQTRNEDSQRKKRKGFSVGPSNLPDGSYRRKSAFEARHTRRRQPLTLRSSEDQE